MRWSFIALAAGLALACKPAGPAKQPEARLADDIVGIEAALSRNADDLEAAGLAIARFEPPGEAGVDVGAAAPQPEPEPELEPDAGGDEADVDSEPSDPSLEPPAPTVADEAEEEADGYVEREIEPSAPADAPARRRDRATRESAFDRWLRRRRARKAAEAKCQRICDLAEATCSLSDQICGLAARHPDEERYENACAMAESQCSIAAGACRGCSQ